MTDPSNGTAEASEPVFRLIYRSHMLIPSEENTTQLGEIFTTARRNNKRLGVTGALVISEDSFVQALEGDESVVRDLYTTIAQDERHDEVNVLEEKTIDERTFGRWAMAKVATDGSPDIRLVSNASKGRIVAAPGVDASITPEQEMVLASMRESAVANA